MSSILETDAATWFQIVIENHIVECQLGANDVCQKMQQARRDLANEIAPCLIAFYCVDNYLNRYCELMLR